MTFSKPPLEGAFLAPMARITDIAFRSISVDYGASLTTTELISANGLIQNQQKSLRLAERAPNEEYFATQLFGKNPQTMAEAASIIASHQDSKFKTKKSYIDINLGCPVPKVVRNGMGSALLKKPELVGKIISRISDQVNNPVTAKIRTGFSQKTINAVEVAKTIEDAGAELLTIHGRTTEQLYTGKANWDIIKKVKEKTNILVAGNGDITDAETAQKRKQETNVDYVAIGRGASGNPLLFKQIRDLFVGRKPTIITPKQKFEVFKKYLKLSEHYNTHFIHQKLQAQHFTKGFHNATKTRVIIGEAKNREELLEAVRCVFENETKI